MTKLNEARKTITGIVTGLIGWGTVVVTSDPAAVTSSEWIMFATVLAIGLGVYSVENK